MTVPSFPSFDPKNAFLKPGEKPKKPKQVSPKPHTPNESATFLMLPLGISRNPPESPGISRNFPEVPGSSRKYRPKRRE